MLAIYREAMKEKGGRGKVKDSYNVRENNDSGNSRAYSIDRVKGGAPTGNQNASKNKQPNNNVIRLNQGGVAKTKQGNSRAYSRCSQLKRNEAS